MAALARSRICGWPGFGVSAGAGAFGTPGPHAFMETRTRAADGGMKPEPSGPVISGRRKRPSPAVPARPFRLPRTGQRCSGSSPAAPPSARGAQWSRGPDAGRRATARGNAATASRTSCRRCPRSTAPTSGPRRGRPRRHRDGSSRRAGSGRGSPRSSGAICSSPVPLERQGAAEIVARQQLGRRDAAAQELEDGVPGGTSARTSSAISTVALPRRLHDGVEESALFGKRR